MANIRLWKLGHFDEENIMNSVFPTKETIRKLREILSKQDENGQTMDLVWGPDIECQVIPEDGIDQILVPELLDDGRVLYKVENVIPANTGELGEVNY